MRRRVVGIFDSGVGGLTVLHAFESVLSNAHFLYYGDNGNAPYGNRTEDEIASLADRGADALLERGADVVVLACNTATAVCAEALRARLPVPVIGMEPAVKVAAARCKNALLLATARTAASERLQTLISRFPQCAFTVHAAKALAGAIEKHLTEGAAFSLAEHLPAGTFDGVVLGCTHYIFYEEEIAAYYHAPVFDGKEGTARRLKALIDSPAFTEKWSKSTKTNKSLPIEWSEGGAERVVFLGKWAEINRKIYKQTFENGNFGK